MTPPLKINWELSCSFSIFILNFTRNMMFEQQRASTTESYCPYSSVYRLCSLTTCSGGISTTVPSCRA